MLSLFIQILVNLLKYVFEISNYLDYTICKRYQDCDLLRSLFNAITKTKIATKISSSTFYQLNCLFFIDLSRVARSMILMLYLRLHQYDAMLQYQMH